MNIPQARTTDRESLLTYAGANLTTDQINTMSKEHFATIKTILARLAQRSPNLQQPTPRDHSAPGRSETRAYRNPAQDGRRHCMAPSERPDAPALPPKPPIHRRQIVLPKPSPAPGAQPELMEEHYKHILEVIQNMSIAMERSPRAFPSWKRSTFAFTSSSS